MPDVRTRTVLEPILHRVRLMGAARHAGDRLRAARAWRGNVRFRAAAGDLDGLPLPPAHLVLLVAGTPDLVWYVEGGRRGIASLQTMLARNAIDPMSLQAILDFGCGCGRVIRHWSNVPANVVGCDDETA